MQVVQPWRRKSPKKRVDRFAANDEHLKCSSPFNGNEECSEGNDSMKSKDDSTLRAVVGEEIEALIKECKLFKGEI